MDTENVKTFTCKQYGTTMLAASAEAFCARRHAEAVKNDGHKSVEFEHCRECHRGAALYDLGLHETSASRKGAKDAKGETNTGKSETKRPQGETIMARVFHIICTKHGAFTAGGPRGKCPECKAENGAETKPVSRKAAKKTSKGLAPLAAQPLTGGGNPTGPFSISVDLSRYPKLHSRLIGMALDRVLEEMEAKA